MTTATSEGKVENGVNVEALLGAREALTNAPYSPAWQAASPPVLRQWRRIAKSSCARYRQRSKPAWTFVASSAPTAKCVMASMALR